MSNKRKQRASSCDNRFRSIAAKEFHASLFDRNVHPERSFTLPLRGYPQFTQVIEERGWQILAGRRAFGCETLVKEFYANARSYESDDEMDTPLYKSWCRGTEIDYSPPVIHALLSLPTPEPFQDKLSFHIQLKQPPFDQILADIAIHGATWDSTSAGDNKVLLRNHLTCEAKVWSHFMLDTIIPSSHKTGLRLNESMFLYCIRNKCPIDVAQIISDKIYEVANTNTKSQFPFPNLITKLVESHKVKFTISKSVQPAVNIDGREITKMFEKAGAHHEKFRQQLKEKELERQQHASANEPHAHTSTTQQDYLMQLDSLPGCVAMGTLLRQMDDLRANQELMWDLSQRQDDRFRRRTQFGEVERRMMQLSIDAEVQSYANGGGQNEDVESLDSD